MAGRILRMPAVNCDRVAGFAVIVREYRRILFQHHVCGKFVPLVVVPGLWIEGRILPRSYRIIPCPTGQLTIMGMIGHQDPRSSSRITFRLLVHGEFVCIHSLVFVNAGFDVPAGEISAIRAGEGACPHPANGCSLPIAIVDQAGIFGHTRILEREPNGPGPGGFGDVAGRQGHGCAQDYAKTDHGLT
jgi:hypothetical protein